jgi:hypothetical protein
MNSSTKDLMCCDLSVRTRRSMLWTWVVESRIKILGLSLMVALAFQSAGEVNAGVFLSNATTSLEINGGEANNGLVPYDGYFRYTDLAANEETTWSIDPLLRFSDGTTAVLSNGGFGSPADLGGVARSTATSNFISTQADTELVGSNARTTFTFTAAPGNLLDGTTFVFYAENDLFGFDDDLTAFQGSIATNDLVLFQYDSAAGGLTVKMSGEAGSGSQLSLFGAGIWTAWGTAIENGDLSVLSSTGSNFATTGDTGLALGFSLSGETATVVINYDMQPQPPGVAAVPEPSTLTTFALGMFAIVWARRRKQSNPLTA